MPVKLLFLLLSFVAAATSESVSVTCTELSAADSICADAPEGFEFTDGCNRIRCLAGGAASSTRRWCTEPRTASLRALCRSLALSVFNRLPSRSCPNVSPQAVCSTAAGGARGFRFTNGCNRFSCSADGQPGGMTRRMCREGAADSAYCQFIQLLNADAAKEAPEGDNSANSVQRRRRSQQVELTCPQLAADKVCGRSTAGFTYSDGCNTLTCHADGTSSTTFKFCTRLEGSDSDADKAYCEAAEQAMRAKMQRSSLRNRCIEPEQVCVGDAVRRRQSFNDGCNQCICFAAGEASCTRRYCPKVLMTDEEFEDYCKQRGADVH